jgi:hypothetical protein
MAADSRAKRVCDAVLTIGGGTFCVFAGAACGFAIFTWFATLFVDFEFLCRLAGCIGACVGLGLGVRYADIQLPKVIEVSHDNRIQRGIRASRAVGAWICLLSVSYVAYVAGEFTLSGPSERDLISRFSAWQAQPNYLRQYGEKYEMWRHDEWGDGEAKGYAVLGSPPENLRRHFGYIGDNGTEYVHLKDNWYIYHELWFD